MGSHNEHAYKDDNELLISKKEIENSISTHLQQKRAKSQDRPQMRRFMSKRLLKESVVKRSCFNKKMEEALKEDGNGILNMVNSLYMQGMFAVYEENCVGSVFDNVVNYDFGFEDDTRQKEFREEALMVKWKLFEDLDGNGKERVLKGDKGEKRDGNVCVVNVKDVERKKGNKGGEGNISGNNGGVAIRNAKSKSPGVKVKKKKEKEKG
jgi:hypothetical protein